MWNYNKIKLNGPSKPFFKYNVKGIAVSIEKAKNYLEAAYHNYTTDSYALAITAYALFKAESPELPNILKLLEKLAIKEGLIKIAFIYLLVCCLKVIHLTKNSYINVQSCLCTMRQK